MIKDRGGNSLLRSRTINLTNNSIQLGDRVGATDSNDFFRIRLTQRSRFDVLLRSKSKVNIRLLNDKGNVFPVSSGTRQNSQSISGDLEAGVYHIQVSSRRKLGTSYRLRVLTSSVEIQDSVPYSGDTPSIKIQDNIPDLGDTPALAGDLGVLNGIRSLTNTVGGNDRDDYYRFTLLSSRSISLFLNRLNGDANLQILDQNGNPLINASLGVYGGGNNQGTTEESISRILSPGSYLIRVTPAQSSTITYTLNIMETTTTTSFTERVVELTNFYRVSSGLLPLRANTALATAAQQHSQDMALRDYASHTSPEGTTFQQRGQRAGYRGWIGENLAWGADTPEDAIELWMNSTVHRNNILNSDYQNIGIGYYYLDSDAGQVNYQTYWTKKLGTPDPSKT